MSGKSLTALLAQLAAVRAEAEQLEAQVGALHQQLTTQAEIGARALWLLRLGVRSEAELDPYWGSLARRLRRARRARGRWK
jgi:Tfp pilus assembly protein PilO